MVCLQCTTKRYTKRPSVCPVCNGVMTRVDGRLHKVVESLNHSDFRIAFATCETYNNSSMCTAEIIIGFASAYDDFVFTDLPEHFTYISDRHPSCQYTLNYLLNHTGYPMAMVMYDYCNHPDRSEPVTKVLQGAIGELYSWSKELKNTAPWSVGKLAGYI